MVESVLATFVDPVETNAQVNGQEEGIRPLAVGLQIATDDRSSASIASKSSISGTRNSSPKSAARLKKMH